MRFSHRLNAKALISGKSGADVATPRADGKDRLRPGRCGANGESAALSPTRAGPVAR